MNIKTGQRPRVETPSSSKAQERRKKGGDLNHRGRPKEIINNDKGYTAKFQTKKIEDNDLEAEKTAIQSETAKRKVTKSKQRGRRRRLFRFGSLEENILETIITYQNYQN